MRKLFEHETRYDARRLHATGFTPRATLADAIADMTRWYLSEGRHKRPVAHIPPADIIRNVPASGRNPALHGD